MKTLCLLESVSRADGGIFESECSLQRELYLGQGVEIDVVGMKDCDTKHDVFRWFPLEPKVVKVRGPAALGYSPELISSLDTKADLLYAATLWKYPSWAALKWADRTGKPLIVAPHGSLDPWALKNSAWKKWMVAALFKNRQLHRASCLRALSQSEAESFRSYGLRNPIAVIPNGVEIPEKTQSNPEAQNLKSEKGRKKSLLFLGRIHPKKGLPNLIRAFKKAISNRPKPLDNSWQLIIAGWDQVGHEAQLIELCEELGLKSDKLDVESGNRAGQSLESEIVFWGPAFEEEKDALLRRADAFILPSLSEGLPMSVLEAWAYGVPVLMTSECNLPEGIAAGAAIRIETGVEGGACGLDTLFSMSDDDLFVMGECGRELVKARFTWKRVASEMKGVYDWLLGGGAPPSNVKLN